MNYLDVIHGLFFVIALFCFGAFCYSCLYFKKPCPSVSLLGLSTHTLLPHSICLLYIFLTVAPFALFPLLTSVILTSFSFLSVMSEHLCLFSLHFPLAGTL